MRISSLLARIENRIFPQRSGQSQRAESEALRSIPPGSDAGLSCKSIYQAVCDYTMTSIERVAYLCHAIDYIENASVPGAIVECGVWRGGSMMAALLKLQALGVDDREVYLFDTFEGMPPPSDVDVDFRGNRAIDLLQDSDRETSNVWARSSFEDVHDNINSIGYDMNRIHFVKGKVEDTLSHQSPERIALLRLDTDWYESTYYEMDVLFPRLEKGGVLIVDDYGHWNGAKKAVDEYVIKHDLKLFLLPIDYTGRIAVKIEK